MSKSRVQSTVWDTAKSVQVTFRNQEVKSRAASTRAWARGGPVGISVRGGPFFVLLEPWGGDDDGQKFFFNQITLLLPVPGGDLDR